MVINHWAVLNPEAVVRDNVPLQLHGQRSAEGLYSEFGCSYPKFYKMDKLCKWTFVAAEYLLIQSDLSQVNKEKVAVAIATNHGCLDVDKRYFETIAVPSPALFVYTLPNIMLGELSIRHGFKGEQLCMVSDEFDAGELYFNVHRFLSTGMDACLCGWADVTGDNYDLCLFWITKQGIGPAFTISALQDIYDRYRK